MERNIVDEDRPRAIASQFELYAAKFMEGWVTAGSMHVSAGEIRMAAEFLRQVGWQVEEVAGLMVKLRGADGRTVRLVDARGRAVHTEQMSLLGTVDRTQLATPGQLQCLTLETLPVPP